MVTGMQGSRARSALAGETFCDIRWVAETDSTNDDVLALARHGAPEGVVIVADHQLAGRGRLGRTWQAPSGSSLLMSVLVRPGVAPGDAHLAATAVACAAVEACAAVAGIEPRLKWPNDLVILGDDGQVGGKVAGVLAESITEEGELTVVVVGIGLNVNWPAELPPELAGIAVALNHFAGHDIDREDLTIALLRGLGVWRDALDSPAGRADLVARYIESCATLGSTVRVDLADESMRGVAVDITPQGHLVVHTDTGARREIVAGDVVHVRAE